MRGLTIVSHSAVIKEHSEALNNISEQIIHIESAPAISYRVSDLERNRMSDLSIIQSLKGDCNPNNKYV